MSRASEDTRERCPGYPCAPATSETPAEDTRERAHYRLPGEPTTSYVPDPLGNGEEVGSSPVGEERDLFGVDVDASLEGALRSILGQFTHEDYCPTQTVGPGLCTCGWEVARDVISALVERLCARDRKTGVVAMRPLSDCSAEQLDRWAEQAEADMAGAAAPPVGVDEERREAILAGACREWETKHEEAVPADHAFVRWLADWVLREAASSAAPGVTDGALTILREALRRAEDETPEDNPDETYAFVCKAVSDAIDVLAVSPAPSGNASIERAAQALVEREADQMEADTDGAGTLDRWDACDEETREQYRSEMRFVAAALGVSPAPSMPADEQEAMRAACYEDNGRDLTEPDEFKAGWKAGIAWLRGVSPAPTEGQNWDLERCEPCPACGNAISVVGPVPEKPIRVVAAPTEGPDDA